MLSVEEEDNNNNEQQLLPNEQLARYRIEEDLLERFDEFIFKCRRKGLRTLKNVNEDSFGVDEEVEGDNGREEEEEMKKIIKKSSKNRGRKRMKFWLFSSSFLPFPVKGAHNGQIFSFSIHFLLNIIN